MSNQDLKLQKPTHPVTIKVRKHDIENPVGNLFSFSLLGAPAPAGSCTCKTGGVSPPPNYTWQTDPAQKITEAQDPHSMKHVSRAGSSICIPTLILQEPIGIGPPGPLAVRVLSSKPFVGLFERFRIIGAFVATDSSPIDSL